MEAKEEPIGSEGYVLNRAEHLLKHLGQQGSTAMQFSVACYDAQVSHGWGGRIKTGGDGDPRQSKIWHVFQLALFPSFSTSLLGAQPAASACFFRQAERRRSEFQDPEPARPGPGILIMPYSWRQRLLYTFMNTRMGVYVCILDVSNTVGAYWRTVRCVSL